MRREGSRRGVRHRTGGDQARGHAPRFGGLQDRRQRLPLRVDGDGTVASTFRRVLDMRTTSSIEIEEEAWNSNRKYPITHSFLWLRSGD